MNNRKNDYPFEVVDTKIIERITFRKLIRDVGKALNLERGILYAVKLLIINPGQAFRSDLYDKRFSFFHPVRLLLLTTAINLFAFWMIDGAGTMGSVMEIAKPDIENTKVTNEIFQQLFTEIFYDYFNAMIWIFIPIISVFTYLFFKKSDYNYAEHLVLNTYVTCVINLINIVSYFFIIFVDIQITSLVSLVAYFAYYLFVFKSLFKLSFGKTMLKGIAALFLGYLLYMLLFSFIIGIAVGYKMAQMGLFDQ